MLLSAVFKRMMTNISLLVLASPVDSADDRVLGRFGALTVLDKGWDVATRIDLAKVKHVGAYDLVTLILDGLDPPAGEMDLSED